MKLTALLVIFSAAFALMPNLGAGPAVSSGPAQPESGIIASGSQLPSGVSPGLNARDSVAAPVGSSSGSSSINGSSNSSVSAAGNNSSLPNGYSVGLPTSGAPAKPPSAVDLRREKVTEISENNLAAERAQNQEKKSEVSKKFESRLLDQGIDKIAKSEADPKSSEVSAANSGTAKEYRDADGTSPTAATKSNPQQNNGPGD